MLGCSARSPAPADGSASSIDGERVVFKGRIFPNRYNTHADRANGHHAIVWQDGRNAHKALIEADAPDEDIQDSLESLGLEPGNNLSEEAWTQRFDRDNPAADKRVDGPALDVLVTWGDAESPMPLWRLFKDARAGDLDIRFGGHRALIPRWKSGCVTCLFSCPGGRTSNAKATLREQADDRRTFVANADLLPPDGTSVTVSISPRATKNVETQPAE